MNILTVARVDLLVMGVGGDIAGPPGSIFLVTHTRPKGLSEGGRQGVQAKEHRSPELPRQAAEMSLRTVAGPGRRLTKTPGLW